MLTYDFGKRGNLSLYEYLYQSIKEDISSGRLKAKEKLPSKRELASHLQVSIKTVENAYAQLLLEGYIYAEEKRGYYVSKISGVQTNRSVLEPFVSTQKEEEYLADFTANNINYEKFPFSMWAKVLRETLTDYDTTLLQIVPYNGVEKLRVEIAKYLYRYRGMQVSPDNIIIGAGTEYLYSKLILLLGENARYAVENPGFRKITKIYDSLRAKWTRVDIDEQGLKVEELKQTNANVVHVSPSHHYPMGLVMPIARRQELLNWAEEETERYIIEDDYDSEFRFSGRPIPAMQSMDRHHRVIYMNTFSKTLVPSIRVSYMVLPQKLMERWESIMNFYSCTVSGFEQYALASFMEKGYFERHIRRMTNYYKQQREKIMGIFRESALGKAGIISEDEAGTHFLYKAESPLSDIEIKWAAKERGILISALSEYCFANAEKYKGIFIINYSDIGEEQLREAIERLEEIFLE